MCPFVSNVDQPKVVHDGTSTLVSELITPDKRCSRKRSWQGKSVPAIFKDVQDQGPPGQSAELFTLTQSARTAWRGGRLNGV